MSYLLWLLPIALAMGIAGLLAFLWSIHSDQYEDLEGAAERVLLADAADAPLHPVERIDTRRPSSQSGNEREAGMTYAGKRNVESLL